MENVILNNSNFSSNHDKKPETLIYEKYMNLKLSIWEQMDLFHETVGVEDPQQIMYLLMEQVKESFLKYSPTIKFMEESS